MVLSETEGNRPEGVLRVTSAKVLSSRITIYIKKALTMFPC